VITSENRYFHVRPDICEQLIEVLDATVENQELRRWLNTAGCSTLSNEDVIRLTSAADALASNARDGIKVLTDVAAFFQEHSGSTPELQLHPFELESV